MIRPALQPSRECVERGIAGCRIRPGGAPLFGRAGGNGADDAVAVRTLSIHEKGGPKAAFLFRQAASEAMSMTKR